MNDKVKDQPKTSELDLESQEMELVDKDEQSLVESPSGGGGAELTRVSSGLPAVKSETEVTLSFIQQIISDPEADMAKFDKIIEWRNAERDRLALIEFNTDMALCQGEIEPVARTAMNTHTNSMYAKVDNIVEQIAPIYAKHGFSLMFSTGEPPKELADKGWQRLVCDISHRSGHTKTVHNDLPVDDAGAAGGTTKTVLQGLASTRTYSRKYMITEIFNVSLKGADQDGNALPEDSADQSQVDAAIELLDACTTVDEINVTFAKVYNANPNKNFKRSITTFKNQKRESLKAK